MVFVIFVEHVHMVVGLCTELVTTPCCMAILTYLPTCAATVGCNWDVLDVMSFDFVAAEGSRGCWLGSQGGDAS